jgi:hypothetical protein
MPDYKFLVSPETGETLIARRTLSEWRIKHPKKIWAFDPFTGLRRTLGERRHDPYGQSIIPPESALIS